jgi:hypothetical protein
MLDNDDAIPEVEGVFLPDALGLWRRRKDLGGGGRKEQTNGLSKRAWLRPACDSRCYGHRRCGVESSVADRGPSFVLKGRSSIRTQSQGPHRSASQSAGRTDVQDEADCLVDIWQ